MRGTTSVATMLSLTTSLVVFSSYQGAPRRRAQVFAVTDRSCMSAKITVAYPNPFIIVAGSGCVNVSVGRAGELRLTWGAPWYGLEGYELAGGV